MNKVEKNEAEKTAASEATTEETKDQPKLSEESKTQVEGVDYKAKLEAERLRREKAEARLVDLKREQKESESKGDEEDRLLAMEERLMSRLEEKTSQLQKQSKQSKYDDAISSVASSEDEAALIQHILDNDIKPTGDVAKDVRRAKILANEDDLFSENTELKKALSSRKTVGGISSGSQRVAENKKTWSNADKKFAAANGLDLSKIGK